MKTLQEILDDFGKNETATAEPNALDRLRDRKVVYEFNKNGDLVKSWKSQRDLVINGGFELKRTKRGFSISRDERIFSYDSCFSNFKDQVEKDFDKIYGNRSMKVCQFDRNGELVDTHDSTWKASKKTQINRGNIIRNIKNPYGKKGQIKTLKGFYFRQEKTL